eukprot:Gb_02300 [translate_table: standard]
MPYQRTEKELYRARHKHPESFPLAVLQQFLAVLFGWVAYGIPRGTKSKLGLPPGPRPLPIIGNLHMIGKQPYIKPRDLSEKYGPIIFLRLGSVPTVVVPSPQMAKLFLKDHDLPFASRPTTSAAKYMAYNNRDIAFAPYGPYWRQMRRICILELLSPKRVQSFKFIREEEVSHTIQSLLRASTVNGTSNPNAVDVSRAVSTLSSDLISRMAFGRKYSDEALDSRGFKAMIQLVLFLTGVPNIADFIPCLGWIDLQGIMRRQKKVFKVLNAFFDKIIEEHRLHQNRQHKDLVDVLLEISEDNSVEIRVTEDNLKAVISNMLVAGTDTSAATLEWAMYELLKNPSTMKNLQQELKTIVGLKRRVEESDLPHLEYLHSVVKETLRLHPPAPLLIPHESTDASTVAGYQIPCKTRLLVNVWAIGRDPKIWEDAEKFIPERFIGSSIDFNGQHFEFIPFGSGRRGCPGMQLAVVGLELALAQLLHCFDWKLPNGMNSQELDMSEEFGLTVSRAVHLFAVPTPRLPLEAFAPFHPSFKSMN